MLWGKLLRTESISGYNFHRQGPRSHKAARVEHNLRDHCIVRYHHSHSPEQSLVQETVFSSTTFNIFMLKTTTYISNIVMLCFELPLMRETLNTVIQTPRNHVNVVHCLDILIEMNGWETEFTLRLSGSSERPAYPGFIVMNTAQEGLSFSSVPSNISISAWAAIPEHTDAVRYSVFFYLYFGHFFVMSTLRITYIDTL